MARWYGILLVLLFPPLLAAQSDAGLAAVDAALGVGDYQRATQLLDSIAAGGRVSPELYQAQGNAYFEAGMPGRAILAYERGLRLRPGHADLINNLRFVREEAGIPVATVSDFWLLRWWRTFTAGLGARAAFVLSICCWWLAVGGALFWYLRKDRMEEKRRFALLPLAVVCALLALFFYAAGNYRSQYLSRSDAAIVLSTATLRVAPTADGSVEAELPEGTKVAVTDRVEGYVKVQLADGRSGYLPTGVLEYV